MRHPFRSFAFFTLPLLLSAACASSDKGAATGKTVDSAASGIEKGIVDLEATLLALKDLSKQPAPDLAPQFKVFTKHLASLESSAKEVAALAAKIDTGSQEYFGQWDAQLAAVQNEDIRARSAKRREAVAASFSKIKEEYSEVRDEFKPLLDDLRDVRTVLEADLTMSGLESLEDTVDDIEDEHEDVRESLHELATKFRELGVNLSRSGPAAAPETAPKK